MIALAGYSELEFKRDIEAVCRAWVLRLTKHGTWESYNYARYGDWDAPYISIPGRGHP